MIRKSRFSTRLGDYKSADYQNSNAHLQPEVASNFFARYRCLAASSDHHTRDTIHRTQGRLVLLPHSFERGGLETKHMDRERAGTRTEFCNRREKKAPLLGAATSWFHTHHSRRNAATAKTATQNHRQGAVCVVTLVCWIIGGSQASIGSRQVFANVDVLWTNKQKDPAGWLILFFHAIDAWKSVLQAHRCLAASNSHHTREFIFTAQGAQL